MLVRAFGNEAVWQVTCVTSTSAAGGMDEGGSGEEARSGVGARSSEVSSEGSGAFSRLSSSPDDSI